MSTLKTPQRRSLSRDRIWAVLEHAPGPLKAEKVWTQAAAERPAWASPPFTASSNTHGRGTGQGSRASHRYTVRALSRWRSPAFSVPLMPGGL